MKNIALRNVYYAAFLALIIQVIGCVENVRENRPILSQAA